MHKTLDRQLKKYFGSEQTPPKEWEGFLAAISDTYTHYDEDHTLIERSLEISSKEHMEYADKLRKSEQHFRTLVETLPDIIVRMDKNLHLIYVSQQVKPKTGLSPETLIGKENNELPFPPDIRSLWDTKLTEVLSTKQALTFEFSLTLPSGTQYLEARLVPETAPDGSIETIIGVIRDITNTKMADEALQASEERFLAFMENNPAVAWMKDTDGKYTYINSVFGKRFHITLEAIKGKTDFDIFPPPIAESLKANDQKVRESGKPLETEEIVPTPDGIARVWLTYKFPFNDETGKQMTGGMAIDITDQKVREEALKNRTTELELLNKTMIGRELKMVELKETIRILKQKLGET